MSRDIVRKARKMAWAGALPEDEPLLNPFKNYLYHVWNAQNKAEIWRDAFLDECHEVMVLDAESASDEAYHS